jgi:uncharacterized protein YegL
MVETSGDTMRPGGAMARRELHFIWLLDTSGSMNAEGKIQALNVAIREAIPQLAAAARDNPNVRVLVRALAFSDGARWHIECPTPVEELRWDDLAAGGHTDMGCALVKVAEVLSVPPMPERAVSPVLVLVTDGHHTDDFDGGVSALMAQRWGAQAVRMAITIGREVNLEALQKFIGNSDLKPVQASNPEALIQQIRWVSRTGIESVSQITDAERRHRELGAFDLSTGDAGAEW